MVLPADLPRLVAAHDLRAVAQRPALGRALEVAVLDELVVHAIVELRERPGVGAVVAVRRRHGQDPALAGDAEIASAAPTVDAAISVRRMSPFIVVLPSVGIDILSLKSGEERADYIQQPSSWAATRQMSTLPDPLGAATERRIEESQERRQRKLDHRERLGTLVFACGFIAAAGLAQWGEAVRELSVPVALAFVVAYAAADRIEFSTGAGYAVPTQLVFVPMLLLAPDAARAAARGDGAGRQLGLGGVRGRSASAASCTRPRTPGSRSGPRSCSSSPARRSPPGRTGPSTSLALVAQFAVDGLSWAGARAAGPRRPPRIAARAAPRPARRRAAVPVGLLAALAAEQPLRRCSCWRCAAAARLRPRARGAHPAQPRARPRLPRHGAAAARPARGGRRVHRSPHRGRRRAAVAVAEEMGVDEDTRRERPSSARCCTTSARSRMPDEIINKPGPLDDERVGDHETHTIEGQRMLDQRRRAAGRASASSCAPRTSTGTAAATRTASPARRSRWPRASSRACDAYNAMTTDRSYRKALSVDARSAELRANSGTQFAPAVVDALVARGERVIAGDWQPSISEGRPPRHVSKPSPSRSSRRSHGPRRPPCSSACASARLVAWITAQRAGSGGNGSGRLRTSSSRVRGVSAPSSRSVPCGRPSAWPRRLGRCSRPRTPPCPGARGRRSRRSGWDRAAPSGA